MNKQSFRPMYLLLGFLMVLLAACQSATPPNAKEVLEADERFSSFVDTMQQADMTSMLTANDPVTLFVPTIEAFATFIQDNAAIITPEVLADVLSYHVAAGKFRAAEIIAAQSVKTLQGGSIAVTVNNTSVILNGKAKVLEADIEASNAVIHLIDTVLMPPAKPNIVEIAVSDPRFSTLVAALTKAELVDDLSSAGSFTVFAPTNDAFAALLAELGITAEELLASPDLKSILLYHVVAGKATAADVVTLNKVTTLNGKDVMIEVIDGNVILNGNIKVIITDIMASNGVIHVIDGVLLPPADPSIVDIAVSDPRFSTLVAALTKAELVDDLSGPGPFTVFAPTNDAFAALLAELGISAEELLANPDLANILLYHVAAGKVTAADVVTLDKVTTLQGDDITVEVIAGEVILNGNIKVIITDIMASNGVIHVIDGVLLPPVKAPSIVDIAVADPRFSTLVAALQKADLVDALSAQGPFTVFAPTNEAFVALAHQLHVEVADLLELPNLSDILLYHVASGSVNAAQAIQLGTIPTLQGSPVHVSTDAQGNVHINHAKVIQADVAASNGFIHVINGVLLPPSQ
jgi:transforming growth factor-beta-induced protein